jgi:hypothetical protein
MATIIGRRVPVMFAIQVVTVPGGEDIPHIMRAAWKGLTLPCTELVQLGGGLEEEVLRDLRGEEYGSGSVLVFLSDGIAALEEAGLTKPAAYWLRAMPADAMLVFAKGEYKRIEITQPFPYATAAQATEQALDLRN